MKKENLQINNESTIEGLFVACKIMDDFEVTEHYEQYVTFGKCMHTILVFPKRILIYGKIDENGNLSYYDADKNEQIKILDEPKPLHSYETESNYALSLLQVAKKGRYPFYDQWIMDRLDEMYNQYGLLTSFEEFFEQKFGRKLENISLGTAKRILKLMNLFPNKPIVLSTDPIVATQQLEKIGYFENEKEETKKIKSL